MPAIMQIDRRVLIVIAVIAAVAFIWSLAKRAVKGAVIFAVVAVVAGVGVSLVAGLQANNGVSYNKATRTLTCKVNGETMTFDFNEIEASKNVNIVFEKGMTSTDIHISYEKPDGMMVSERGSSAFQVPNFMAEIIKARLDKAGMKYGIIKKTDSTTRVVSAQPNQT
jgi:hypothetical protein